MNRAIPDDIVEEIRSRCNIVDVIGSYVPLKKAGAGTWKAICPFHNEKTPSFTVNENKQVYHCFGCGKGGDLFRFVMDRESVDFPNAIHLLAARCGVIIPESSDPREREQGQKRANARERLYKLNEDFAAFFMRNLEQHPDSEAAVYLRGRGIDAETCRRFQIGVAPDSWDGSLKYGRALGYTDEELVTSGTVRRHEETNRLYDHFKGRITFTIWNEQGRVAGFSARTLEAKPKAGKYVNTPETPVFKKGHILYALPLARQAMAEKRTAILCEGQLDVIAMHRAGFPYAVAPQGTGFTEDQARMLKRYCDKVLLAFDGDGAGHAAVMRAFELLLPLEFEIGVVSYGECKDSDELFHTRGAEALGDAINGARGFLDVLLEDLSARFDLSDPAGVGKAAAEAARVIRMFPNPVGRELYIRRCAKAWGVSETSFTSEFVRMERRETRRFNGTGAAERTLRPETPPPSAGPRNLPPELTLLALALEQEDAARRLAEELPENSLSGSAAARALDAVLAAAANGEHARAAAAVAELLRETPDEEVSRVLTEDCPYAPAAMERVLNDCLADLARYRVAGERQRIMEALKHAATAEEKAALFKELQALC